MQKAELRKLYREKRIALSDFDWQQRCIAIQERVLAFFATRFEQDSHLTVHTFLPIRRLREVDTYPIIVQLCQHYHNLRVLISQSHPDGSLSHVIWSDNLVLTENQWGIPEPLGENLSFIANSEIDVVLVPLLVFDKKGHRVGYGKGYYDRFLANCREDVLIIGLSLFKPIEAILDTNIADIPLTACITPFNEWYFFDEL